MRIYSFIAGISMLTIALTSCGGSSSSSSSSSGIFNDIPEMISSYEQKEKEITSGITENNYEKKEKEAAELKEKTLADVEKAANELNGKEIACAADETQLKIEKPVSLIFKSMNKYRPVFQLGGEVVAASDLALNVKASDLGADALLSKNEITVTVKMPVALDFIDKEGTVIKHLNDIGTLEAANDGETAIVKTGTPVDFCRTFVINEDLAGTESIRLSVELDKSPYTSRSLK